MARPNLLLIHGMCCDSSFWEPQVAALSDAGYRVASPDLPWHGGPTAGVTPSLQGLSAWVAGSWVAATPNDCVANCCLTASPDR